MSVVPSVRKENRREQEVIDRYEAKGFEVLTKGWPDLLCHKDGELILVEVKRTQKRATSKMGLSAHQRRVHELLRAAGLKVRVQYVS